MAKTQKSLSLPREFYDPVEEFYNLNAEAWHALKIDSPVELLQVMANLGRPNAEKLLAEFRALAKIESSSPRKGIAPLNKVRKQYADNQKKP